MFWASHPLAPKDLWAERQGPQMGPSAVPVGTSLGILLGNCLVKKWPFHIMVEEAHHGRIPSTGGRIWGGAGGALVTYGLVARVSS